MNDEGFDVVLVDAGPRKIQLIKLLRELEGCRLKEAKAKADAAPCVLFRGLPRAEAEDLAEHLRLSDATIRLEQGGVALASADGPDATVDPGDERFDASGRPRGGAGGLVLALVVLAAIVAGAAALFLRAS